MIQDIKKTSFKEDKIKKHSRREQDKNQPAATIIVWILWFTAGFLMGSYFN